MDPQKINFSFGDYMSTIKVEIVRQVINSAIRNGIDINTIAEDYQQVRNTLSFSDAQKELKGKMLSTDEKKFSQPSTAQNPIVCRVIPVGKEYKYRELSNGIFVYRDWNIASMDIFICTFYRKRISWLLNSYEIEVVKI